MPQEARGAENINVSDNTGSVFEMPDPTPALQGDSIPAVGEMPTLAGNTGSSDMPISGGGGDFGSLMGNAEDTWADVTKNVADPFNETKAADSKSMFSGDVAKADSGDTDVNDASGKKEGFDQMKGVQFLAANGKGLAELSEDDFTMAAKGYALDEIDKMV